MQDSENMPTLKNTPPIAGITSDETVILDATVILSAAVSEDEDGDSLNYQWELLSIPNNSNANLSELTTIETTFIADVIGDYSISLTVNDGTIDSSAATVIITVTEGDHIETKPSVIGLSYAIVDTNQTSCYDSTTGSIQTCTDAGQDAEHTGYQPNYTVSDNGLVVTDNVTGLVWQQSSDVNGDGILNYDDKLYQSEAVSYCENLSLEGNSDWRLPNIKESFSLILFSGKDASSYQGTDTSTLTPFIASEFDWAFGDLNSGIDRIIDAQYASTTISVTPLMSGIDSMFGVNFIDGRIKGYPKFRKEFYVRCVNGNEAYGINDYVDNGDFTITDNATGLMWQQNDSASTDWDDAVAQCKLANTADYNDWRLPNVKELQSIVDYDVSPDTHDRAAINLLFKNTVFVNEEGIDDWGSYWASTTHADNNGDGSNGTYVSFGKALGYMNSEILDVHGAGAQRSNDKLNLETEPASSLIITVNGSFYIKGPQGDILRLDNPVRCVRDSKITNEVENSYTLFAPMGSTDTLLINDAGDEVHSWSSTYKPGLSVYLLESGELLRTGALTTKPTTFEGQFGGSGGVIEVLDWDGSVVWSKTLATETYFSHHDVEVLPNGNILAIVWEAKTAQEAIELGRTRVNADTLWADAVYEICRSSADNNCTDGEVVWRWSTWDHIIQNNDDTITATYVNNISDYPDKIDLNYFVTPSSDWTHTNSIDYNPATKEIVLSVHGFNEYWIIKHGDNTQGIVRRAGNPAAHGSLGEQILFGQHDARWIETGTPGAGNILVFNNGNGRTSGDYSSVDEFCDNDDCILGELINSYSQGGSGDFYADHISGAERLPNGNTVVCEGTEGRLFEINANGDVTWEYIHGGEIFKANRYYSTYNGLQVQNKQF
ncbi:DUF1566 domain-containing protein [Colwellia sp. Arc7-635]|uniref:Lcl domain-containing protein n=1 Tax=Colwellia sp. Arc7-635 TaxID=2497879 RepID=UPI000F85857F|nr:DUF1566 domain-containing protein [Colwellia sp. Arc7-635]AZQ85099.1 DUF1566 domain-containing protein [Colwellia sp. Arc7-635]